LSPNLGTPLIVDAPFMFFSKNKLLNVTHNVFGKEAFDALISCAKNIKQLVVTRYDVTADDIKENGEVTIEGVPRSEDVINSDVWLTANKELFSRSL